MTKSQIILLSFAALLTIGMLQLPKAVVSNKEKKLDAPSKNEQTSSNEDISHSQQLSPEQTQTLQRLKKSLELSDNPKKKINFADSIANLFKSANFYDSAAVYFGYAMQIEPNTSNAFKAGNGYYEAFRFAISVDVQKANQLGAKARQYFQQVLDKEPNNFGAKANMAMTYVTDPNPMQGIGLLRQILEKDPKNELAIFNLGLLSIQSEQLDKAIQRFEELLKINPNHVDGKLYLGKAYADKGNKNEAKKILKEIIALKGDSLDAYRATAADYLKALGN